MLSFKPSHSAIESKHHFRRFTHFMPESDYEHGILHTDLNEYDAIILPLRTWLESRGAQFNCGVEVTEIQMDDAHNTVTGLLYETSGRACGLRVDPRDMVIFTNDSMTQNSAFGDNTTVTLLKKVSNIRGRRERKGPAKAQSHQDEGDGRPAAQAG